MGSNYNFSNKMWTPALRVRPSSRCVFPVYSPSVLRYPIKSSFILLLLVSPHLIILYIIQPCLNYFVVSVTGLDAD